MVRHDWIIGKNDLQKFTNNVGRFGGVANLLFGGRENLLGWQIKALQEKYGEAIGGYLKQEWTNPYNLIALAHLSLPRKLPINSKIKFTKGKYKYEVRSHDIDLTAPVGTNSANGPIYRVSRQKQGLGTEYLDVHGNWHHQSTLRSHYKDERPNPNYNARAANETHIPNKDKVIWP